jgi:hypothetical protein
MMSYLRGCRVGNLLPTNGLLITNGWSFDGDAVGNFVTHPTGVGVSGPGRNEWCRRVGNLLPTDGLLITNGWSFDGDAVGNFVTHPTVRVRVWGLVSGW